MLQPIRQPRLYEAVVERILDLVRLGEVKPGERFPPERELEAKLRVSRPVLREAFRVLEASGLVHSVRGGGRTLRPLSEVNVGGAFGSEHLITRLERGSLLDIWEVRVTVETRCAVLAAERATQAETAELARIVEQLGEIREGGQWYLSYPNFDIAFHLQVARMSNNFMFERMVAWLLDLYKGLRQRALAPAVADHSDRQALLDTHRRVLQGVQEHNPEAAARAMADHLEFIRLFTLNLT